MNDLTTRADIEQLVDTFYARVRTDDRLGPIFNDVARVNWDEHLPKMYAFWEAVLFGVPGFKGNPLATHLSLGQKTPLTSSDFDRWLELFHGSLDELFAGPMAIHAKRRSEQIAGTMLYHLGAARGVLPGV